MTFYGPAMETALTQQTEEDKKEIQMERSDIYAHLIDHAQKAGVKTGDIIAIQMGSNLTKYKVLSVNEYAKKDEAANMYEVIS